MTDIYWVLKRYLLWFYYRIPCSVFTVQWWRDSELVSKPCHDNFYVEKLVKTQNQCFDKFTLKCFSHQRLQTSHSSVLSRSSEHKDDFGPDEKHCRLAPRTTSIQLRSLEKDLLTAWADGLTASCTRVYQHLYGASLPDFFCELRSLNLTLWEDLCSMSLWYLEIFTGRDEESSNYSRSH